MEASSHIVEDSSPSPTNPVIPDGDPRWARQLALEDEMHSAGIARYTHTLQTKVAKEIESETPYGQQLLGKAVGLVVAGINEWMGAIRLGRRTIALKYLRMINVESACYIGVKTILDGITRERSVLDTANRISIRIEEEQRWLAFKAQNPHLYKYISDELYGHSSLDYRITAMRAALERQKVEWEPWPQAERIHLGMRIIDVFVAKTGLAEIHSQGSVGKGQRPLRMAPTQALLDWIRDHTKAWEILDPTYLPMLIPPRPWDSLQGGGYWSLRTNLRLIKKRPKNYFKSLAQTDLSRVYKAVNILQNTAWKINEPILAVAQQCWDMGWEKCGLPSQFLQDLPARPLGIDADPLILRQWKLAAKDVYEANAKRTSRGIQTAKILWVAKKFKAEDSIYFPYQLDFRGRAYAVSLFLQPQGCDLARGLLKFASGKPLGSEMAAYWLAIHGANTFGFDKVSLEDRVMWAHENTEKILACAADPFNCTWWTEADGGDKPFQFLAFCHEWAGYMKDGLAHVTHIPIALDGSCNGLQHFSAMLRDPVGGAATNLIPSETPRDIYADVALKVTEALRADADPRGKVWADWGITRKLTKRPVMVLPYGGTRHACLRYVDEMVYEMIAGGKPDPFGKLNLKAAIRYLAQMIWAAIGQVVVSAFQVMTWLRSVAKTHNKANLPIVWESPAGFTVLQSYYQSPTSQIKVQLLGKYTWMQVNTMSDITPDLKRQVDGISPNFVHSLDAAAMMLCLLDMDTQGVSNFAMIHDSYGTLAPDTTALGESLRRVFVDMYTTSDPLKALQVATEERAGVLLELPPKGTLDLALTNESRFFFA